MCVCLLYFESIFCIIIIELIMRKYRLVLLLKSNLAKEKKSVLLDDIKKWIGEIKKEELKNLGERKLAYPIGREKTGDYVVLDFETAKGIPSEFEKRVIIEKDNILRHLLLRQ